jgi:hypothetical protein
MAAWNGAPTLPSAAMARHGCADIEATHTPQPLEARVRAFHAGLLP